MPDTTWNQRLKVAHPIVLGAFGGLSSIELTAAVSNRGGLGSYGLYGYTPEQIEATVAQLRAATSKPFAVNLWCETGTEVTPADVDTRLLARELREFYDEVGMPLPTPPQRFWPDVTEQFETVLALKIPVLSTVYGVPPAWVIDQAKAAGTTILGTATTVPEAIALAQAGVDGIIATGMEAAGHRTAFLREPEEGLVGLFSLIPQVVDAVDIPVIAAGGIADRRGVAAAFALGAHGAQVGTAFLGTEESAANTAHKEAIRTTAAHETVLTRAMSGRLSRGVRNRAVQAIETRHQIAPFPAQNWLTSQFRKVAGQRNRGDLQSLWVGQSAPLVSGASAAQVMEELIKGLPKG